jgi:hypothetical protein
MVYCTVCPSRIKRLLRDRKKEEMSAGERESSGKIKRTRVEYCMCVQDRKRNCNLEKEKAAARVREHVLYSKYVRGGWCVSQTVGADCLY